MAAAAPQSFADYWSWDAGSGLLMLYGGKPQTDKAVAGNPALRKITALCGEGDTKISSSWYPFGETDATGFSLFFYLHLEGDVYFEATGVT